MRKMRPMKKKRRKRKRTDVRKIERRNVLVLVTLSILMRVWETRRLSDMIMHCRSRLRQKMAQFIANSVAQWTTDVLHLTNVQMQQSL